LGLLRDLFRGRNQEMTRNGGNVISRRGCQSMVGGARVAAGRNSLHVNGGLVVAVHCKKISN
jgi:hypothetical protein